MKQYLVRFPSGHYVMNCKVGSGYMTYDRTYWPANAQRFYDFDSKLVIHRLAEEGQKAEREEAEDDRR